MDHCFAHRWLVFVQLSVRLLTPIMAPKLPPKWYQFLVSMFASLGSVLYGYDLGVIAGAVDSENFQSTFQPSGSEQGAVVALFTAGAFFGAGAAGPVADKFGRRWTLLSGSVIFLLGGGLQAGAMSLPYMYAGRGKWRQSLPPLRRRMLTILQPSLVSVLVS